MNLRRLAIPALLILMVSFGFGVYFGLGALRHSPGLRSQAEAPEKTRPAFSLPGAIVVSQAGTLYLLEKGVFKPIASGGWVQPAVTPDHKHLVAVKRDYNFSDLYLLDMNGKVEKQLTNNSSGMVQLNHWALYPKVSSDGQTVYYDYDPKKCPPEGCYQVDFSVVAQGLNDPQSQSLRWTYANGGTGGDIQPTPLGSGLVYTSFEINDASQILGRVWWQPSRQLSATRSLGHALSPDSENCYAPAISADGHRLAMVCSPLGEATDAQLVIAPFDGQNIGPTTVVANGLINSPSWAPDGSGLIYFATVPNTNGFFQLYYLPTPLAPPPTPAPSHKPAGGKTPAKPVASTPTPAPPQPRQITTHNNFDPTSAAAWFS